MYRLHTRSFKAKFLVFPIWIRGFQIKGTNKALCQEDLILNMFSFCLNETVMNDEKIMHSDAIGRKKLACIPGMHWYEKASVL